MQMTARLAPGLISAIIAIIAAVAGCAIAGCAGDGTIDGAISYRSTGGFSGQGDGSPDLQVELDGTVMRVLNGTAENAKIDQATLDDLHDKVHDARFPDLEPLYSCQCADDFLYTVSVHMDGKLYGVMAHSQAQPPQRLRQVIDALRAIGQLPIDWH
jgi:hypothetical protein